MELLITMEENEVVTRDDLPAPYHLKPDLFKESPENRLLSLSSLKEAKIRFEKEFILRKLEENAHNITQTAKAIGVKRSYLYKKLKK